MPLDERIRDLLANGDARSASATAVQTLGPRILGYLRAVLRDEADAADAFSIWAEHVWRGIATFRGDSSIRTWAFKVAWNASLNVRDDAWKRLGRRLGTGEASRLAEEIRTATVERVERQRDALASLRESLSPEDQTLLSLRIDQKLTWSDIGEVLGVEPVVLRKRFERLKDRLGRLARARGLIN